MGEFAMPPVTLEFAVTQPAAIVEYCKQLMDSVKMLERQVQGLVRDDRASKSAEKNRKEKQWHFEKERLISDLEVANLGLVEKGEIVHKLEKDLRAAKLAVEQLQSKSYEAEKRKERESMENDRLKGVLEDARLTIEELQKSCSLKDDAVATHRKAFSDLSKRMDSHKKELEQSIEEGRLRRGLLEDLELENQTVKNKLEERNKMFVSLKQDYENLRLAHKGMSSDGMMEREDVIKSLEENEALCEEQACTIRKLEKELRKVKSQAKQMETRCTSAEAEVNSKSSLLAKALIDLETSTVSIVELAEVKEEATLLVEKMTEFENELAQEKSLRFSAERALQDHKLREAHLLKLEEHYTELQQKAKWKDEQFESLEEAHRKLQKQLKESQSEWKSERGQMLKEIDCLRDGLESKAKLAQHLDTQLDMLQQALDHELILQTDLERGMRETKAGMNSAAREFEKARLAFDIVRDEFASKISVLDEFFAEKVRELREVELNHIDIVQADGELERLAVDPRKQGGELQEPVQPLDNKQTSSVMSVKISKDKSQNMTKIAWDDEKEKVLSIVRDAEACLAFKDVRLKELGIEVGGSRSMINVLRDLEAGPYVSDSNEKCVGVDDSANVAEGLKIHGAKLRSLEIKRRAMKIPSTDIMSGTPVGQVDQIQELSIAYEASLQDIVRLKEQETELLDLQTQYRSLQKSLKQRDEDLKKMQVSQDKIMARLRLNEKAWHDEREKLVTELDAYESREREQERQKVETRADTERLRDFISKLEVQRSSLEQEIAEQSLLAELATGQLAIEKAEGERLKREAQLLSESFGATIASKEDALEELRNRVLEMDDITAGNREELDREILLSKSLEERLKVQQDLKQSLEKRMRELKEDLDESTGETARLAQAEQNLLIKLRQSEDELRQMKGFYELQLERSTAQLSLTQDQLLKVEELLGHTSTEREALVSNLSIKEAENVQLCKDNETFLREKSLLKNAVKALEEKQQELVKEVESNKTAMEKLCEAREEAEATLASKTGELQDISMKLGYADTMSLQLQIAEEKTQAMEESLSETRAIVEEKEERLAASEWAVQQLATEIAKAKHSLKQKEREESFLQARLSDLERHLREKEREMEEMEMHLNVIMQSNEEKQADIDTLTLKMRDLKKGADEWKLREIDLETELHCLRNTLEESEVALAESKCEVQRGLELHKDMENAIESLKKQLSDKGLGSSDQRSEMDRLCCDLDSANEAASLSTSQLQDLRERLQQLEQSSEDRIKKEETTTDEALQELEIMKMKFQRCEHDLEVAQAALSKYKENCESLLEAISKKTDFIEDMESKLAIAEADLARQSLVVEQAATERARVLHDLKIRADDQKELEMSGAKMESHLGSLELHKEKMDQEVKRLKKSLETARKETASKGQEVERYKSQIEEMREIADQYGDAQVLISQLTNELQVTSSTVEERDCRLLKHQASLVSVQHELYKTQDMLAMKECDREHLAVKLTMIESHLEKNQAEMFRMQEALECAERGLQTEATNVLRYVEALKELQDELDEWKGKSSSLIEEAINIKRETELSLKDVQLELLSWKGRAEDVTAKNFELEGSMQILKCELEGWKEAADVAAQEVKTVREQIGTAIKNLRKHLVEGKQEATCIPGVGMDTYEELEIALQAALDELKGEELSVEVATAEEVKILCIAVKLLFEGFRGWRRQSLRIFENDRLVRENLDNSISDLCAELEAWKVRTASAEDSERKLRTEFAGLVKQLEAEVDVWKTRTEDGNSKRYELERSVDDLQLELVKWKDRAAAAVDEERRVKMTHEASLVELQEELEIWKEKVAIAAEERNHQHSAFAVSTKEIQSELQSWKEKATAANEERKLERELQVQQDKAFIAAEETKHLQSQLQLTLTTVADLTLQLELQKQQESSVMMRTQQLEYDLMIAREEATFRKAKMLDILNQLESTHASQKSLQAQLKIQHERLLHDDDLAVSTGTCSEVIRQRQQLNTSDGIEEAPLLRAIPLESQKDSHRLARDSTPAVDDLSVRNIAINELAAEVPGLKKSLAAKRHTTEGKLQISEVVLTQDQQCRNIAEKSLCRKGSVDIQQEEIHSSGPHSYIVGNSTSLQSIISPRSTLVRRRNVPSQVHGHKTATRIFSTDAASCNILGEVDENSLTYGPRSPATHNSSRKSRDNQTTLFMGSLF